MKVKIVLQRAPPYVAAIFSLILVGIAVALWKQGETWWILVSLVGAVIWVVNIFLIKQSKESNPTVDEYSQVINTIAEIATQLSNLSGFLQKERARVADTEATIKKLDEERSKLEPLVITQRETVEAILTAHAERTASRAWRERLIGFSLGLGASLIASVIYSYFKG